MATNDRKTPYELFYGMKPDAGHVRTFGCIVKVILLNKMLGKLDDWVVMGYLLGYKYDSRYWVCIPRVGVRETQDIVFHEGKAPIVPIDGMTIKSRKVEVQVLTRLQPTQLPPPAPLSTPQHGREEEEHTTNETSLPDTEMWQK